AGRGLARRTAWGVSVAGDVRGVPAAAWLAVLAIGEQVVVTLAARCAVNIGVPPWIERHRLAQVRTVPLRGVRGFGDQRGEALLVARERAYVESVGPECPVETLDLCLGEPLFRFGHLAEVPGRDIRRQQPDDH